MQTTLTLQSTLAFLGGIASGALISISAATAISSLMLIATAKPSQACLATIPTESAAGSARPHHSIGYGVKPFGSTPGRWALPTTMPASAGGCRTNNIPPGFTCGRPMLFLAITAGFIAVLWLTQVLVRRSMDDGQ